MSHERYIMSNLVNNIKTMYSDFYSHVEPFTPDTKSTVQIVGINNLIDSANSIADNQAVFVVNNDSNNKCKVENDILCARLNSEWIDLSSNKSNRIAEYNSINNKYTQCQDINRKCNDLQTHLTMKQSELKDINRRKQELQTLITACDDRFSRLKLSRNMVSNLENELNRISQDINSIYTGNARCSAFSIGYLVRMKENEVNRATRTYEHSVNDFKSARMFQKIIVYKRLTNNRNELNRVRNELNTYKRCQNLVETQKNKQKELAQLKQDLVILEQNYKDACPDNRYSNYTTAVNDADIIQQDITNIQKRQQSECSVIEDCDSVYKPSVDAKYAELKNVSELYLAKQAEYITCMDPTRNACSVYYNKLTEVQNTVSKNVSTIRAGLKTNKEGFCENVETCIEETKQDYAKLETDRSTLKSNADAVFHAAARNTATGLAQQTKYDADSAIYANIILTTASISLLYFLFARIK